MAIPMPHGQLKILTNGLLATGNLEAEPLIEVRTTRVPMDGGALIAGTHASSGATGRLVGSSSCSSKSGQSHLDVGINAAISTGMGTLQVPTTNHCNGERRRRQVQLKQVSWVMNLLRLPSGLVDSGGSWDSKALADGSPDNPI